MLQSSLANGQRCVFQRWRGRGIRDMFFVCFFAVLGNGCQDPLPPPHHGLLRHESIVFSHHGDIKQKRSAQGHVGGQSPHLCFRLGCSSLDLVVNLLGDVACSRCSQWNLEYGSGQNVGDDWSCPPVLGKGKIMTREGQAYPQSHSSKQTPDLLTPWPAGAPPLSAPALLPWLANESNGSTAH